MQWNPNRWPQGVQLQFTTKWLVITTNADKLFMSIFDEIKQNIKNRRFTISDGCHLHGQRPSKSDSVVQNQNSPSSYFSTKSPCIWNDSPQEITQCMDHFGLSCFASLRLRRCRSTPLAYPCPWWVCISARLFLPFLKLFCCLYLFVVGVFEL